MTLTTDPNHPGLKKGDDTRPMAQQGVYLVLSEEERSKGFVKPLRNSYIHRLCAGFTMMKGRELAETYARDPFFYGGTYCVHCRMHRPLNEFTWLPDGEPMDPNEWPEEELQRVREAMRHAR